MTFTFFKKLFIWVSSVAVISIFVIVFFNAEDRQIQNLADQVLTNLQRGNSFDQAMENVPPALKRDVRRLFGESQDKPSRP